MGKDNISVESDYRKNKGQKPDQTHGELEEAVCGNEQGIVDRIRNAEEELHRKMQEYANNEQELKLRQEQRQETARHAVTEIYDVITDAVIRYRISGFGNVAHKNTEDTYNTQGIKIKVAKQEFTLTVELPYFKCIEHKDRVYTTVRFKVKERTQKTTQITTQLITQESRARKYFSEYKQHEEQYTSSKQGIIYTPGAFIGGSLLTAAMVAAAGVNLGNAPPIILPGIFGCYFFSALLSNYLTPCPKLTVNLEKLAELNDLEMQNCILDQLTNMPKYIQQAIEIQLKQTKDKAERLRTKAQALEKSVKEMKR